MDASQTRPRRWFRRRGEHVEQRALTRETWPAVMLTGTESGASVSTRGALALADVWACVRVLSQTAATLPLHGYRRTADGRERVAVPLLEQPAPGMPVSVLIGQAVAHLCLWGECFIGVYRSGDDVQMLGLLAPDAITVTLGADGEPAYMWTPPTGGSPQRLTRRDVIHARMLTLDGVRGCSPVAMCRETLGLSGALSSHAAAAAASGYRPDGVVSVREGPGADDLVKNLQGVWSTRHAKPNKTAFVTSEITYTAVSTPARDAEFLDQRRYSTVEVARLFGVPPSMISAPSGESMTYSTQETEAAAFLRFGLQSYLGAIEEAISISDGVVPPGDTFVRFAVDALLRPDSAGRASFYAAALDGEKGWMQRSEVRALEDLPPEPASRGLADA